ncbi:MAG: hypothetical protein QHC90_25225 [Shinella sp.]|nr:hypothetical protein [Shinella sp.]
MTNEKIITLNEVFSVRATRDPGVFVLDVDLVDMMGERYRTEYVSSPDDTHGLGPTVRQWLTDNEGSYTIEPYVPPTLEQIRASMPSLTARQLRLGLLANGYAPSQVADAIATMPDGEDREKAQIEWEYATTFDRTHPFIASVAVIIGLTDEQIDDMWVQALPL